MEDMRVIDLPRMDPKALQDLLAYNAYKYQDSYKVEM